MFDVHVPSNRLETLKGLIPNFQEFMAPDGFRLCLNLQFPEGSEGHEWMESQPKRSWMKYFYSEPQAEPSMFALRRAIAAEYPGETFMIFDDDDRFRDGSAKFYMECYGMMQKVKAKTGRPTFFGCTGHYGSISVEDRIHITTIPLLASNMGLIFDKDILIKDLVPYDSVKGGLEEALMCALAISFYQAIPLKRFRCPTYKKRRQRKGGKADDSYIHNMDRILQNAVPVIRELSGNLDWSPPRSDAQGHQHAPKAFVKYATNLKKTINLEEL